MSNQSRNKKLKSTFAIHHGAPVWILEEVESEEVGSKAPNGDKLEELLRQLATSDQPGLTLQWDDSKNDQGWEFHLPKEDEAKNIPDRITVKIEQESDDEEVNVMPPVKYFQPDGTPVYYFQDPVTGHKYWDECDCEACVEDCILLNDGLSPSQLKKKYALENPPKQQEPNQECSTKSSN
jgi:hypothetical protein